MWNYEAVVSCRKNDVNCTVKTNHVDCFFNEDEYFVAVLSDGDNFARLGNLGAEVNVTAAHDFFQSFWFEDFFNWSEHMTGDLVKSCLEKINSIKEQTPSSTLADFSATLIFFLSDGFKAIIGQIGDGIVCAMSADGEVSLLSVAENFFTNPDQKYFTVSMESKNHTRLTKIDDLSEYVAVFLISEKLGSYLYNPKFDIAIGRYFENFYSNALRGESLSANLWDLLDSISLEHSLQHNDCSIIILYIDPDND